MQRSWLVVVACGASLLLVACRDFSDRPGVATDIGAEHGDTSEGASTFKSGSTGEPGVDAGEPTSTGGDGTEDGGVDLEDGGAFTNVGTGLGTSGGIPGAAGLGASGVLDPTSGGIAGAAGLGASGTGVANPADAGTGDTVIIVF